MKMIRLLVLGAACWAPLIAQAGEETLSFGPFGELTVFRENPAPTQVVLFLSGDGGFNSGVKNMARHLSVQGALVVGIDIRGFLKAISRSGDKCAYPAADLEALSQFVQKKFRLPRYIPPILAGYSSGATLV